MDKDIRDLLKLVSRGQLEVLPTADLSALALAVKHEELRRQYDAAPPEHVRVVAEDGAVVGAKQRFRLTLREVWVCARYERNQFVAVRTEEVRIVDYG